MRPSLLLSGSVRRRLLLRAGDRPFFRITDYRVRPAMEVCLPAQRSSIHADGRVCTWMYETRNETEPVAPPRQAVDLGQAQL